MSEPRYQHIARVRILSAVLAHGVSAKVIVVAVMGFKGPVQPSATEPLFLDVSLAAGATQTISLEPQHNAFVYVDEDEPGVAGAAPEPDPTSAPLDGTRPPPQRRLVSGNQAGGCQRVPHD